MVKQFDKTIDKISGEKVNDEAKKVLLYSILGVKAIWLYAGLNGDDPMRKTLRENGEINFWLLSHALTFYLVGKAYPNKTDVIFKLGIVWELYEALLSRFVPSFWSESFGKQAGDVLFNQIGYFLSSVI
jgi:hypothetical protein